MTTAGPGDISPSTLGPTQRALLRLYALLRRTGILRTPAGQWVFEHGYELYKEHVEGARADMLRRFVRPGTCVIDVGANIGFFARRFARWVGPPGRVLALEPEADNVARLRERLTHEGLMGAVEIVEAAATDRGGPVRLEINPDHPGDHRLANSGRQIDGTTLDHLLEVRGWPDVSLIKIDVQGAEHQVIMGAQGLLRRSQPALYVEVDDRHLRNFGSSASDLVNLLAKLEYAPYRLAQAGALIPANVQELLLQARNSYLDVLFCSRTRLR